MSDEAIRGRTRSYKLSTCKLRELVLTGDVIMVYIMTCRQVGYFTERRQERATAGALRFLRLERQ